MEQVKILLGAIEGEYRSLVSLAMWAERYRSKSEQSKLDGQMGASGYYRERLEDTEKSIAQGQRAIENYRELLMSHCVVLAGSRKNV
jgi:hypothetical protein